MTASRTEVWITGVGTANPLGFDFAGTADAFLAGHSGIRSVTQFNTEKYLCRIGGAVPDLPTPDPWTDETFGQLEPIEQLLIWCGSQALRQAGLWDQRTERPIGLALGCGGEWGLSWVTDWHRGGRRVHQPEKEVDDLVHRLQRQLALTGPALTIAAACASGNYALALARRWIEMQLVDVCLAGAGEVGVTPLMLASFGNLGVLSKRNDAPEAASRPFDRGRDGIVLCDGGAFFVLENGDHARRRGAVPLAALAGFGATSDAAHMVIPSTDARPAAAAMRAALRDAQLNPDQIDYLNAHATSTPVGDSSETRVLQTVFGEASRTLPVSASKSMTGHALSGAAALGALACLTALQRQAIPPTINLDDPDPECSLCHVPHQPREQRLRYVAANSFGFGGSNTCLILKKAA
jgi:3-oxoacyl-[acyl-carrier-protein] synthase II